MKIFNILPLLLLISLLSPLPMMAAEEDLFDSPFVRDEISLKHRPIYFDNEERKDLDGQIDHGDYLPKDGWLEYHFLSNRRALTGESCNLNKLPTAVGVGAWTGSLNALINDDLEDLCEFNEVVNLGVTVNPVFSIRDRSCYYAKGTEAGFCLVASGTDVLSLDVVKAMAIGFYRDGKLVKVVPAKEGQDGSGVTLSLIQVPGTEDAVISVTADAPGVFDEISLDYSGGVNLTAGQNIRVKYGFVGKSRMFTITKNKKNGAVSENGEKTPFQEYNEGKPNENADLDYVKAWNPFALGLPFPVLDSELQKFIDADLENYISLTPILAVGYQGGAKFMMKDTADPKREVFEAGTEVGFTYDFGSALSLDLGSFMNIVLFDRNGNKVADETVTAGVLALSVAKGGGGSTSIVSKVPFSGAEIRFLTTVGVDLGGIFVKYAYIRDKADIRHHCPINPSMDTPICPGSPEYQLRSNPDVSVTWTVESQPKGGSATVTADGYVKGMSWVKVEKQEVEEDGSIKTYEELENEYVFRATAADGCYELVTLRFDGFDEVDCAIPLVNEDEKEDEYELAAHVKDGNSGSLITIDKIENPENVLTQNNTAATYKGGLKIGNNIPIIGIKKKNGLIYDGHLEPSNKGKRMGFIVESTVEGLNLSALQFYQIGFYCEGNEVFRKVIDESNLISADVGGANKSQKIRFSTVIPSDINYNPETTDHPEYKDGYTKVDQIVLWASGVIELKIGDLNIYNAFFEDAESDCSNVMGCSTTLLTSEDTHTTLDFDRFKIGEAVSLASAINDLDNMVDDDIDSYATIFKTVGLSGVTIAIKLGKTLDYRHQIGILTDNNSYLLGVKVADVIQVKTLYRGQETGEEFNDWNIVDANVIGYGDKKNILISPKYMYDEILLTFVGTVNVLNDIRVYGLYIRGDVDGDGIPDCQDSMPCSDIITDIRVTEVCQGDIIQVSADGNAGEYKITFSDNSIKEIPEQAIEVPVSISISEARTGSVTVPTRNPGIYQVVIYDADGKPAKAAQYKVHPLETQWLTSASSSDWTKWDNWSNGSPYCCTNVVIPSKAINYPDLSGEVIEGDEYCCNYIHFEPGAEVNSVTKLNYNRAWTEVAIRPNKYHLLSAPLQSMYSGDMFIPASMNGVHSGDYFIALDDKTSTQNRFNPTIYQRLWSQTAKGRLWADDYQVVDITPVKENFSENFTTEWSREFNHLATPYSAGMGFSLWVDNGNLPENLDFRFRFPKEHTIYNYFSDFDQAKLDITEELKRENIGRFIYETNPSINPKEVTKLHSSDEKYKEYRYNDRKIYNDLSDAENQSMTFNISADNPTNYFLFGNPFMSRIDVVKFLEGNSDTLSAISIYDGNNIHKVAVSENGIATTLSDFTAIPPMQALYVMTKSPADNISIEISPDMLTSSVASSSIMLEALRINLRSESEKASMIVTSSRNPVVSEALLENEVAPHLALFANNNNLANDITTETPRIPLTIIKNAGEEATLDFESFNGCNRDNYRIVDLVECVEYTLDHPVPLPKEMGASSGRFVLLCLNAESGIAENEIGITDIIVEASQGLIHVRSLDEKLSSVIVHSLDGKIISNHNARGANEISFASPQGIFIVDVLTIKGTRKSLKLISK